MMQDDRSSQIVIAPPEIRGAMHHGDARPASEENGFLSDDKTSPTQPTLWLLAVRDRRDRAAFMQLFEHFGPRLKAMLIRGGLRDGSAEDVVQDVMLTVWHKAAQFDPHRAEASAWIYRIARNRRIDLARRKPPPEPDPLAEPEGSEPDAPQILALGQEATLLRRALEALSPDQAKVLEQAYFEDLPHSRISEMTGLPLGTIKSRIRLGLERLRRDLKDLRQP
ncbi:sigma-70 family RNA polymerase sigma factor [Pseudogemmobacter faecipullorum]|nr:sigma-70 family RNA polymerase sigma factor [Pseudogemmobacter faecipullorum]